MTLQKAKGEFASTEGKLLMERWESRFDTKRTNEEQEVATTIY